MYVQRTNLANELVFIGKNKTFKFFESFECASPHLHHHVQCAEKPLKSNVLCACVGGICSGQQKYDAIESHGTRNWIFRSNEWNKSLVLIAAGLLHSHD